jgi:hypothetical protein
MRTSDHRDVTAITQGVLQGVPLVIEQPEIAHRTPQMTLVHDPDEGRIAGRGHPPDALDVVHDPLPDGPTSRCRSRGISPYASANNRSRRGRFGRFQPSV